MTKSGSLPVWMPEKKLWVLVPYPGTDRGELVMVSDNGYSFYASKKGDIHIVLLSFMKQFASKVKQREKLHSIRLVRKKPIQVGDVLHLYTGLRTANCQFLRKAICTQVQFIKIVPATVRVRVDGELLTPEALFQLAVNDGFDNGVEFVDFFRKRYAKEQLCNDLRLIHWQ